MCHGREIGPAAAVINAKVPTLAGGTALRLTGSLLTPLQTIGDDMFAQNSLEELLDRIGADTPSPGSGTAAAAVLAIGIACLRKAIAVSARHKPADADLKAAGERLSSLADQAVVAATADEHGFPRLLAAEKSGSDADRSSVAEDLVALGQRFQHLCQAVHREADQLESHIVAIMVNDLLAARVLSDAAGRIARANADENASLI
jgi:formiminotetrahydrofolate cyclodeaminase